MVAGRSVPWQVLVGTLICTWIGSGSLFGGAGRAFREGFSALWMSAGAWVGIVVVFFLAARVRRIAEYTVPDLLERRYHPAARLLGTTAIGIAYLTIAGYQFVGGGRLLAILFPGARPRRGHDHRRGAGDGLRGERRHAFGHQPRRGERHHHHRQHPDRGTARLRRGRRRRGTDQRPSGDPLHPHGPARPLGGDRALPAHHAAPAGRERHVPEVLRRPLRGRGPEGGARDDRGGDPDRGPDRRHRGLRRRGLLGRSRLPDRGGIRRPGHRNGAPRIRPAPAPGVCGLPPAGRRGRHHLLHRHDLPAGSLPPGWRGTSTSASFVRTPTPGR